MRFLLSLVCLFSVLFSGAQKRQLLETLLKKNGSLPADTNSVKHLLDVSQAYRKINPDSAVYFADQAERMSVRIGNEEFLFRSKLEKIYVLKNNSSPPALIDSLNTLNNFAALSKYKKIKASVCQELGIAYRKTSNFDKSTAFLLEALKLAQEIKDPVKIYNCYNSLANTYSQAGVIKKSVKELERALEYYEKAFEHADKNKTEVLGMILNNQGVTYFNIGQINRDSSAVQKAVKYYRKSLEIRTAAGDSAGMTGSYGNLGSAYHELSNINPTRENLNAARYYYEKDLELGKKINNPLLYQTYSNYGGHLALIAKTTNDPSLAKKSTEFQKLGLQSAYENDDIFNCLVTSLNIATTYQFLKQADSALVYLYKHLALKDTILNQENKQIAEELAAKYESELKDTENKSLKEQSALKEEVISKKNGTIRIMIIASVIMLALIVLVFLSRQKIRKSKQVIEAQKKKTEEQKLLLEEKQKEILDSINYSKRLQDAAIPSADFFKSLFPESFIYYNPKDIVAGDFYWAHKTRNGKLLVAAADCTGHGVPGALVSIVCLNALNRCVDELKLSEPSEILDKASEIIQDSFRQSENDVKDGMDIAMCLIDPSEQSITYSGAHNPMWLLRKNSLIEVKGDNQPVGKQYIPRPFSSHAVSFEKGDILVLSTDGFSDQFGGENGKKLKTKKFKQLLESISTDDLNKLEEDLRKFFQKWKGTFDQVDDVLVVGVKLG